MKDLVSRQFVKYLENRGIKHVFGICGHTNIAVLAEMEKSSIKFVNGRHEQIVAHAADGYARVTREASVVLLHIGPGMTNAVTSVATAALDCTPMVIVAGDIASHFYGKNGQQEVSLHADGSQYEIFKPIVKRAWRVERPEHFPEIIEKAFQLAVSGQPGPVLVDVPMDIFSRECDVALFEKLQHNAKKFHKPTIDEETATKIVQTLMQAKYPLLHVGGGIVLADAAAELQEFVNHLSLPVSYSTMGKGALPDDNPFTLGMAGFWGTKFINGKCLQADYIMALGTRFAEADSSSWEPGYTFNIPPTKLIHIDIEASEIGRNFPVEIGVVADLKQALTVLNRVAKRLYPEGRSNETLKQEIAANKESFREQNRENVTSDAYPMRPERILAEVREVLPRNAIVTTDVGWNKNGVGQQFPICVPGCVLTPGGFATMGFGSPAALGAKIAAPDRVVVSLVGDGGFGQNPAVLATAVEDNVATIWVIMNNNAYGVIAGLEKAHFGTTFGTIFPKGIPDYAAVARAYGAEGESITSAEEFKPALERAVKSNKPYVIDVQMQNVPTPTAGHWNIMDIYSPNKEVHHVSVE